LGKDDTNACLAVVAAYFDSQEPVLGNPKKDLYEWEFKPTHWYSYREGILERQMAKRQYLEQRSKGIWCVYRR